MASLYNADLKPLGKNVPTHPYDHATKLFLDDNYRLSPKQSFLYYVCINIDVGILQSVFTAGGGEPASSQSILEQYEAGLLAKKVELPKFSLSTKTMNAYNRKNIIQTGITYDPINITFHDDAADVVTTFWNDYYTYYYRDSDYNATLYQVPHKYQPRLREGWGFTPRNLNLKPFLRNIQIFSLHNKRFTEYLLINPFITGWRHGEHNSTGDTGIMESTMTLAYETVKYRTGYVNPVDVNGFSILHYDNTNSPISTSTTNIYTDAGLIGAIEGAPKDLSRPDGIGSGAGLFGSILAAYRTYKGLKNANWGTILGTTVGQIGVGILNGAVNGAANAIFAPTPNTGSSQVVSNQLVSTGYSPYSSSYYTGAVTQNGIPLAYTAGAAISGAVSRTVYDAANNNASVSFNSATGQTSAGVNTAYSYNGRGTALPSTAVYGGNTVTAAEKSGENYTVTSTDQSGNVVKTTVYNDGTRITRDINNNIQQTVPGANTVNGAAPTNTSTLAANGQTINPSQPQYYTDPRTGITYTVGGTGQAQFVNSVTGATGAAAGLYAGSELNSALNNTFLGKSVIGRTVATTVSGVVATKIGVAVNNGLQPIINKITGDVIQGWDSLEGKVKNVVGSWSGSGGYNPGNPSTNVVTSNVDELGNTTNIYKNGDTVTTDTTGKVTVVSQGSLTNSFTNFFNGTPGTNSDPSVVNTGIYNPQTIYQPGSDQSIFSNPTLPPTWAGPDNSGIDDPSLSSGVDRISTDTSGDDWMYQQP
jgi:hypothetical protein